jgi:hypothetical protein
MKKITFNSKHSAMKHESPPIWFPSSWGECKEREKLYGFKYKVVGLGPNDDLEASRPFIHVFLKEYDSVGCSRLISLLVPIFLDMANGEYERDDKDRLAIEQSILRHMNGMIELSIQSIKDIMERLCQ